jgi:hypothetical protein
MNVRDLILKADIEGLRKTLSENPTLANEGLPLLRRNSVRNSEGVSVVRRRCKWREAHRK